MKYRNLLILFSISVLVVSGSVFVEMQNIQSVKKPVFKTHRFHTEKEVNKLLTDPPSVLSPIQPGEYFLHSENCRTCHGSDSAHYANINYAGEDINLFDDWEGSMMANSARDPLWRAKVSHEILVDPGHANELQDKCTSCHAPQGRYTAHFKGNSFYTINDLVNDTLGLDGIACQACHTIGPNGLGNTFSGIIPYDTLKKEYGPFTNPILGPMQLYTGFTPTFSNHMGESRACSPCHTLITNTSDLSGNLTGKTFVEQATFHEWKNSSFPDDNITCQQCHMPRIEDSIRIANGYMNIPPRAPFNRHKFMGGNAFMVELIKNNKTKLGINVPDKNFDSTIAITKKNLRYSTVDIKLFQDSITTDTAFYRVRLLNAAGHKFPTGYPSRRAVLQFVITGTLGDTLFKTGVFDANGEVIGFTGPFEKHYDVINQQNQHQVYEMVMGDVNGNRTTVLERADTCLKDNRLPPTGFTSTTTTYDTIRIAGDALTDSDFNKYSGGLEGSGWDFVHFHIPISGFPPSFSVYTRLLYQTVPPGWLNEMFSYNSAAIDSFKLMFNNAPKPPLLIDEDSLLNIALLKSRTIIEHGISIGPDPSPDGNVTIFFSTPSEVSWVHILNNNGQTVGSLRPAGYKIDKLPIQLPSEKGMYLIDIYIDQQRITRKVIRN